jgi:hypothetical protein
MDQDLARELLEKAGYTLTRESGLFERSDSLYAFDLEGAVSVNGRPDEPCESLEDLKKILSWTPIRSE